MLASFPLGDTIGVGGEECVRAVMDLDGGDSVALGDGIDDVLAFGHFTENGVFAIEVWRRSVGDEELGTVGVRSGVRHGQHACFFVFEVWLALTLELVTGATHTCASRVAALDHKVRDHTVEYEAVVESTACEAKVTSTGHLGIGREHADFDSSLAGIHCNVDVCNIAHVASRKTMDRTNLHGFFTKRLNNPSLSVV